MIRAMKPSSTTPSFREVFLVFKGMRPPHHRPAFCAVVDPAQVARIAAETARETGARWAAYEAVEAKVFTGLFVERMDPADLSRVLDSYYRPVWTDLAPRLATLRGDREFRPCVELIDEGFGASLRAAEQLFHGGFYVTVTLPALSPPPLSVIVPSPSCVGIFVGPPSGTITMGRFSGYTVQAGRAMRPVEIRRLSVVSAEAKQVVASLIHGVELLRLSIENTAIGWDFRDTLKSLCRVVGRPLPAAFSALMAGALIVMISRKEGAGTLEFTQSPALF